MRFGAGGAAAFLMIVNAAVGAAQESLEQRVKVSIDAFTCARLSSAVRPDGAVVVFGRVASDSDLKKLTDGLAEVSGGKASTHVEIVVWPFCGALEAIEPARVANQQLGVAFLQKVLGVRILPRNHTEVYYKGEPLIVDVTAPAFDSHVYVDYFQIDGKVSHLLPNDKEKANMRMAGQQFVLGDNKLGQRTFPISPPFGKNMITIVASYEPLFTVSRPEIEESSDYLPALSQAIRAQGAGNVVASVLYVTTMAKADAPTIVSAARTPLSQVAPPPVGAKSTPPRAEKAAPAIASPTPPRAVPELAVDSKIAAPMPPHTVTKSAVASDLPKFAWPPPTASTSYVVPRILFRNRATVGGVFDSILVALEQTGYVERSFYRTDADGVALVTRLERMNEDGSVLAGIVRRQNIWNSRGHFLTEALAHPG